MADLPEKFLKTMRELLGEEYESFLSEFDDRRHYGLRLNVSKITKEEFERIAPFHLKPIPWIENGYFYEKDDNPARHPFYAAGLYYLQEPSAMTPASRLKVLPGERVLDLCAAPGGKATALAADLQGQGLLVANDINTARARALLRNLELFGIRNSFVTNEPPHIMAEKFPEYFHKIMVDAPCSGEGMFRKNPAVMEAWMEKGPEYFSTLQKDIIVDAADMLRPGGTMFYSTCTFSPLENESTITWLLEKRPEMEVIPMEDYEGFSHGLTSFGGMEFHPSCDLTRRIWPHHMSGEGHFLALLRKKGEDAFPWNPYEVTSEQDDADRENQTGNAHRKQKNKKDKKSRKVKQNGQASGTKEQRQILMDFLSHVRGDLARVMDEEHLEIRADKAYFVPEKGNERKSIHFLRNGVYLGDLKKNRFEPSQPFALALSAHGFDSCLNFPQDDPRLHDYLCGEALNVSDLIADSGNGKNGWYLVLADGYPLGFGKLAGTTLKNKYPTGWRQNR